MPPPAAGITRVWFLGKWTRTNLTLLFCPPRFKFKYFDKWAHIGFRSQYFLLLSCREHLSFNCHSSASFWSVKNRINSESYINLHSFLTQLKCLKVLNYGTLQDILPDLEGRNPFMSLCTDTYWVGNSDSSSMGSRIPEHGHMWFCVGCNMQVHRNKSRYGSTPNIAARC